MLAQSHTTWPGFRPRFGWLQSPCLPHWAAPPPLVNFGSDLCFWEGASCWVFLRCRRRAGCWKGKATAEGPASTLPTLAKGVHLQAVTPIPGFCPGVHWKLRGIGGNLPPPSPLRWGNSEGWSPLSPRGAPAEPQMLLEVTYLVRPPAPPFPFHPFPVSIPVPGIISFLSFLSFFFFFGPSHTACGILIPQPVIEPVPLTVAARNLNHCLDRQESPLVSILEQTACTRVLVWSLHLRKPISAGPSGRSLVSGDITCLSRSLRLGLGRHCQSIMAFLSISPELSTGHLRTLLTIGWNWRVSWNLLARDRA